MRTAHILLLALSCGSLMGCQPTADSAGPVAPTTTPNMSGVIALMKLGPEFIFLYDTNVMTQGGADAFARQHCNSIGQRFVSIEHRSIAHPDQLPQSGKAGFVCS